MPREARVRGLGSGGRARGAGDESAARGAARAGVPADGRDHRAGAERTWEGAGVEIAAMGDDEPGTGAAHRGVRVRPESLGRCPPTVAGRVRRSAAHRRLQRLRSGGARVRPGAPGVLEPCPARIHQCVEKPRAQPEEAAVESAGEGPARAACLAANPSALRHRAAHPRRAARGTPPRASGRERCGARCAARLALLACQ